MSLIIDALVNLWRLIRNARARLLGRPPEYVWIEVSGPLAEFETPVGFLRRRLSQGPSPPTLERLRLWLDRLAADGRPRGVVLRIRNLDAGWAAIEELRREILAFRSRGGRVVAYFADPADIRSYYLACAADEILAVPLAELNVVGIRARVDFLKDALDNLGLEAKVIAVSPYKSAGERFVSNDFSRESREQAGRLLDSRFEEVVGAISDGRDLSPEQVRAKIDLAPYGASQALSERPARRRPLRGRVAGEARVRGTTRRVGGVGPGTRLIAYALQEAVAKEGRARYPLGIYSTWPEQETAHPAALRRRGAGRERVRRRGAAVGGEEPESRSRAVLRRLPRRRRAGFGPDLARGRTPQREKTGRRPYGECGRLGRLLRLGGGEPRRRTPQHAHGFHRRTGHPSRRSRTLREAGYQPRRTRKGSACRASGPQPPAQPRRTADDRRPDRTHLHRVQGPCRPWAQDGPLRPRRHRWRKGMDGYRGDGARAGRRDRWFQGSSAQGQGAWRHRAGCTGSAHKDQPSQRRTASSRRACADRTGRHRGDRGRPFQGFGPAVIWRSRPTTSQMADRIFVDCRYIRRNLY